MWGRMGLLYNRRTTCSRPMICPILLNLDRFGGIQCMVDVRIACYHYATESDAACSADEGCRSSERCTHCKLHNFPGN